MSSMSPGTVVQHSSHKLGPPSRALPRLENLEMVSPGVEGVKSAFLDRPKPEGRAHLEPDDFASHITVTARREKQTSNRPAGQTAHICNPSTVEAEIGARDRPADLGSSVGSGCAVYDMT